MQNDRAISFELEDLDSDVLPGGSGEPVIHLVIVLAVIFGVSSPAR